MLAINMEDVLKVVKTCIPYLIGFGIVLVLALIVIIVCRKVAVVKRKAIRSSAGIAILLAFVTTVNLICFGPMSSLISLSTGNGTITQEASDEATALGEEIGNEGIVLLKNENKNLPLADSAALNVFGWASTNPCYGGTGSGSLSDAYETTSLLDGLKEAGIETNQELSDFYVDYRADRPEVGMWAQDWTLPEPPQDQYSDELIENAKGFSEDAMVVITRVGGEGADLPTDLSQVTFESNSSDYEDFPEGSHFLELTQSEKDMIELVCANFDNVTLVYNGANAMELGFVDEYEQIKSAIWCPGAGQSGFRALGNILSGEVNPSGKTSDIFVKDLFNTPTSNNFGHFAYDNMEEFKVTNKDFVTQEEYDVYPNFINYVEGIYVGYRFYETASDEGFINYDDHVQYPFGYGLSYTTFEQEMSEITVSGDELSFDVTVKNTGDVSGKDVVEVYSNPPYTNGGIEKSTANLVAFEKTNELEPGDSETISITINKEDLASYDSEDAKAYVLEEGDYKISVRGDSHRILDEKTVSEKETIVYDEDNKRSTDEVVATNAFDHVAGDVTYLSRADKFANYEEATAAPESFSITEEAKATFINNANYNPEDYNNEEDAMPTTGAGNDITLAELRGADYEDERWETLLDNLTIKEMDTMIAIAGYQTSAADSVGKVGTIDCDGPASINNNFTGTGSIGFPSAVMIASTWNKEIAERFGESIGTMADDMGVSGWYAPAMNTHRSAFAGRNFEYYSEDGVLAGEIAAKAVQGAKSKGVYAYLKHYALNDQETDRNNMLVTWANEQSIREIYLKPFEEAVKKGEAQAIMSAFNYIGTEWAGGSDALLNQTLRNEWGFKGFVLTDYFGVYGYMNADQGIRNGNDAMLVAYDTETNHVKDTKSATSVNAMRQSCKNIMYTVVNSRAYEDGNLSTGLMSWQIAAIVIDVILGALMILLAVLTVKKYKGRANNEAKRDNQ
ncbi:beta-glucosidase [Aequitasia blattaphilus]|uniref:Glycoside hydrolase family 3 C-terminal domain-containing protein n=1 Tax=Aequitasia blattaphilus TaxID=2949332 RepID=A0ABT1ECU2_9FIRM|nr:glycoside hydrolase family 3 N-terminal domain-containing protein [Aequitasia blattaphilus]MCP1102782.1 glycoside hydrolase family 3 C-terminal domain-containing protein [Aequitasia blattaphilus]MCR8615422.1 glycoside hydrolase family 3 C-terminal domain-containing protein [Aequitasia blattaphilus]